MKNIKPCLKRILCLLLVGCILSSSMFVSYSNTLEVHASDDYLEDSEMTRTVIRMALIVIGLAGGIYTGGVTAEAAIFDLMALWGGADYIYSCLTENEDGTYTIDEAFIQQVVSSIEDLANSTFNGDDVSEMGKGNYTYTVSSYTVQLDGYKRSHLTTNRGSCTRSVSPPASNRIAGCVNKAIHGVGFYTYSNLFGSVSIPVTYEKYKDGVLESTGTANISAVNTKETLGVEDAGYYVNFPVFTDITACENYVKTGTGYKDALNYSEVPPIGISTMHTGTWTGGNITVSKRVLDGIIDKVNEVNETDKSIDEKVDEIIDFINDLEDGGGVPGGDDDVIGGSSWLEKIYNVLLKILDKIKSIRRWVIADTIIDGVDLVEDLIKDVWNFAKGMLKTPVSAFASIMKTVETLGDALSVKFPFCIPWDVAFLLGLFRADPMVPHYEIPFKYGSEDSIIHIDEVITIDLEEFEIVSRICRTFLTVIFCKGLLDLTMKIVNMKEQEYNNS